MCLKCPKPLVFEGIHLQLKDYKCLAQVSAVSAEYDIQNVRRCEGSFVSTIPHI